MALRPKQQLPLSGRMVLDPGPQGIASPSLSGAGATVRLDTQAEGIAKIGEGLQNLGSATSALAEKVTEARSITGQNKAAEIMAKANADIANGTATEPDAKKWGGISDNTLNTAEQQLQALDLDPKTREIVNHKFAMNKYDVQQGLGTQAIRKDFGDARAALINTMEHAARTGDTALYNSSRKILTAGPHPFAREDEAVEIDDKAKAIAKETQDLQRANVFAGIANKDPDKAREFAESPNFTGDEIQRARFLEVARSAKQRAVADATQQGQDMLAQPETLPDGTQNPAFISSPKQFDTWRQGDPLVTPEVRSQLKAAWDRQRSNVRKQQVAANAPAIFSKLYTEVQEFDGSNPNDPNTQSVYVDIRTRIGELPPDAGAAGLQAQLDAKWKNKPAPVDKTLQGGAHSYTNSMFKDNKFGKWQWDEPILDGNTGKPVMNTHTHLPETRHIVDESAKRAAMVQKMQFDTEITREIQRHPEWANDPNGATKVEAFIAKNRDRSHFARIIDDVTGLFNPPSVDPGEATRPRQKVRVTPKGEVIPEPPTATAAPPTRTGSSIADSVTQDDGNILLKQPEAGAKMTNLDERTTKNIKTLHADVQPHAAAVVDLFNQHLPAGYEVRIIDGSRTHDEQAKIYAQGRTAPGKIVSHSPPGHSKHESGRAFDIGIFKNGKYLEESPLYAQLGPIGETVGFEWGGRWKGGSRDEPHFQMPAKKG